MEFLQLSEEYIIAVALMGGRVIVGTLFVFQAYDKIFKVGLKMVSNTIVASLGNGKLNNGFVFPLLVLNSWVELVAGLMLVLGFMKGFAACALIINLILVSIGFSWSKPIWDELHVFVRLSLLLMLMLLPQSWDLIAIDQLIQ